MSKTRPPRPVPADFAEVAARLGQPSLIRAHYKCGPSAFYRWLDETGVKVACRNTYRHAPKDFALIAARMTGKELRAHYGINQAMMTRWIKETGIKPFRLPPINRLPVPDDFAAIAPTMHKGALLRHYGVAQHETIDRWIRESGVKPAAFVPVYAPKQPGKGNLRPSRGNGKSNVATLRVKSLYDEAADELRRNRWQVNRCDEKGVYAEGGRFWRVGTVICTPDELLARAERAARKAA